MSFELDGPPALTILADFALATAIFSAYSLGLFEPFRENKDTGVLKLEHFGRERDWNIRVLSGLAEYLARRNVLKSVEDATHEFVLGELGEDLVTGGWIAYIVYYVGGYGNVLLNAQRLTKGELVYGQTITRDVDWVAIGTELMSLTSHHGSYSAVLAACRRECSERVLDIGCGTGKFLVELVKAANSKAGVGVDSAAKACEIAHQVVSESSRDKRIDIVCGDFLESAALIREKYGEFDVITALMIIHEYLYQGEGRVVEVLMRVRELLSRDGSFVLLDKATDSLQGSPVYFTEFKLAHDLTNQDLCSRSKWGELIDRAGLKVRSVVTLPVHTGSLLLECVRK